ncbi:MAG: hypothetical protein OES32_07170 [Acidobacteriota bacterium]|nr:hypothetical protein [Acidobacteriota bacterium]
MRASSVTDCRTKWGVPAFALLVGLLAATGWELAAAQSQEPPAPASSVRLPAGELGGMAWDGERLWILGDRQLTGIDPASGEELERLDVELERPGDVTFDGTHFWVTDEETMQVRSIDRATGQVVKTIALPIPEDKGFDELRGVAWDGTYLWAAYWAGFSSSLNQVDVDTGELVRSVFADCSPRGIATDSEHIWLLCERSGDLPPIVDRRQILDEEQEMLRSRRFVGEAAVKDPRGLVRAGTDLWYLDRASSQAFRLELDESDQR